jgi:hypothetical protein
VHSRALYSKDQPKNKFTFNEGNHASGSSEEPVRPGTKTKLEHRHQPTQSNFDVESDINTMSHTRIHSGFKLPTSPHFVDVSGLPKPVSNFNVKQSENIIESEKRMKLVNNIALVGAGFD